MNVERTPEAARRVEAEASSGRVRTAQDALDHAVAIAQSGKNRAEIEATEAEGGEFTSGEVLRDVDRHLAESFPKRGG